MSESRQILADMANGLFSDLAGAGTEAGADFAAAWPRIEEAGFATLLIPEAQGGFGGDWGDAYTVMRAAGHHALCAPVAEAVIAHGLLAVCGIAPPAGLVTFAAPGTRVAYGRHAAAVVSVDGGVLALYGADACRWDEGLNPAGEPSDAVTFTGAPLAKAPCTAEPVALGAFARVAQSAGALEAAFTLTLDYVNTRVQFGKPLAKFQAVQQAMAEMSVETAAVDASGQALATAMDCGDYALEIAAAKLRTNMAIERCFPSAHRLHGAIGFTMEYALQRHTRRMMGWRGEFGNDAYWGEKLGHMVAGLGGTGLWHELARRGDRLNAA